MNTGLQVDNPTLQYKVDVTPARYLTFLRPTVYKVNVYNVLQLDTSTLQYTVIVYTELQVVTLALQYKVNVYTELQVDTLALQY